MLQAQRSLLQSLQIASLSRRGSKTGNEGQDVNSLVATFIRNVSHELRTPVGIIQGYAELLHGGNLGELAPEQQQAAFIIVNRAHELHTIVERIGILLAAKSHTTVSMPLALTEVATRVVEEKRAAATQAGLEVDMQLETDIPSVRGDPYHLQHAVDCLVENALKFTPGGGRVKVAVYTEPGWVCLTVTDTGIGITKQELESIFTGFYQVDGSTTRRYAGIGLGLTVVRSVVEEHAGQIEVESQPDQGSRFTIKLPLSPADGEVNQSVKENIVLQHILIVDDKESVALALRDGLEVLPDCEITVATSGEQALQLFEQQSFDLLITDYNMPGMDGITLARHVQQLYPRTVTVMITAYTSETLREQAARLSVRRVLDKPVALVEVRNAVLEALNGELGNHPTSA